MPTKRDKHGASEFRRVNWVSAWHFKRLIFDGTPAKFLRFAEKRLKPRVLPGDIASFTAIASALGNLPDDGK